jgi:Sec-independent protein translocase protein TatA
MYTNFPLSFLNTLGGSPMEMAVVIIAVLVLFGAKSLPQTLRTLGRWSEQLRQISRDIQREITDAGEPFQEARKEWEETNRPYRVERNTARSLPEDANTIEDLSETGESDPSPADTPGTRASRPQTTDSRTSTSENPSHD